MRIKSFLLCLTLGLVSLGFVGCGSSSDDGEFVAGTVNAGVATTGNLVFNFATAQNNPFNVDANTNTVNFQIFGTGANALLNSTLDFANQLTLTGVPLEAGTVIITGFNNNGIPLFTITQGVAVAAGVDTVVDGLTAAQDVTLNTLRLSSGDLSALDVAIAATTVTVNGTGQVILNGVFSNGTDIPLIGTGQVVFATVDGTVATVDPTLGTITGVAVGTTNLTATFGGQTITIPVTVAAN